MAFQKSAKRTPNQKSKPSVSVRNIAHAKKRINKKIRKPTIHLQQQLYTTSQPQKLNSANSNKTDDIIPSGNDNVDVLEYNQWHLERGEANFKPRHFFQGVPVSQPSQVTHQLVDSDGFTYKSQPAMSSSDTLKNEITLKGPDGVDFRLPPDASNAVQFTQTYFKHRLRRDKSIEDCTLPAQQKGTFDSYAPHSSESLQSLTSAPKTARDVFPFDVSAFARTRRGQYFVYPFVIDPETGQKEGIPTADIDKLRDCLTAMVKKAEQIQRAKALEEEIRLRAERDAAFYAKNPHLKPKDHDESMNILKKPPTPNEKPTIDDSAITNLYRKLVNLTPVENPRAAKPIPAPEIPPPPQRIISLNTDVDNNTQQQITNDQQQKKKDLENGEEKDEQEQDNGADDSQDNETKQKKKSIESNPEEENEDNTRDNSSTNNNNQTDEQNNSTSNTSQLQQDQPEGSDIPDTRAYTPEELIFGKFKPLLFINGMPTPTNDYQNIRRPLTALEMQHYLDTIHPDVLHIQYRSVVKQIQQIKQQQGFSGKGSSGRGMIDSSNTKVPPQLSQNLSYLKQRMKQWIHATEAAGLTLQLEQFLPQSDRQQLENLFRKACKVITNNTMTTMNEDGQEQIQNTVVANDYIQFETQNPQNPFHYLNQGNTGTDPYSYSFDLTQFKTNEEYQQFNSLLLKLYNVIHTIEREFASPVVMSQEQLTRYAFLKNKLFHSGEKVSFSLNLSKDEQAEYTHLQQLEQGSQEFFLRNKWKPTFRTTQQRQELEQLYTFFKRYVRAIYYNNIVPYTHTTQSEEQKEEEANNNNQIIRKQKPVFPLANAPFQQLLLASFISAHRPFRLYDQINSSDTKKGGLITTHGDPLNSFIQAADLYMINQEYDDDNIKNNNNNNNNNSNDGNNKNDHKQNKEIEYDENGNEIVKIFNEKEQSQQQKKKTKFPQYIDFNKLAQNENGGDNNNNNVGQDVNTSATIYYDDADIDIEYQSHLRTIISQQEIAQCFAFKRRVKDWVAFKQLSFHEQEQKIEDGTAPKPLTDIENLKYVELRQKLDLYNAARAYHRRTQSIIHVMPPAEQYQYLQLLRMMLLPQPIPVGAASGSIDGLSAITGIADNMNEEQRHQQQQIAMRYNLVGQIMASIQQHGLTAVNIQQILDVAYRKTPFPLELTELLPSYDQQMKYSILQGAFHKLLHFYQKFDPKLYMTPQLLNEYERRQRNFALERHGIWIPPTNENNNNDNNNNAPTTTKNGKKVVDAKSANSLQYLLHKAKFERGIYNMHWDYVDDILEKKRQEKISEEKKLLIATKKHKSSSNDNTNDDILDLFSDDIQSEDDDDEFSSPVSNTGETERLKVIFTNPNSTSPNFLTDSTINTSFSTPQEIEKQREIVENVKNKQGNNILTSVEKDEALLPIVAKKDQVGLKPSSALIQWPTQHTNLSQQELQKIPSSYLDQQFKLYSRAVQIQKYILSLEKNENTKSATPISTLESNVNSVDDNNTNNAVHPHKHLDNYYEEFFRLQSIQQLVGVKFSQQQQKVKKLYDKYLLVLARNMVMNNNIYISYDGRNNNFTNNNNSNNINNNINQDGIPSSLTPNNPTATTIDEDNLEYHNTLNTGLSFVNNHYYNMDKNKNLNNFYELTKNFTIAQHMTLLSQASILFEKLDAIFPIHERVAFQTIKELSRAKLDVASIITPKEETTTTTAAATNVIDKKSDTNTESQIVNSVEGVENSSSTTTTTTTVETQNDQQSLDTTTDSSNNVKTTSTTQSKPITVQDKLNSLFNPKTKTLSLPYITSSLESKKLTKRLANAAILNGTLTDIHAKNTGTLIINGKKLTKTQQAAYYAEKKKIDPSSDQDNQRMTSPYKEKLRKYNEALKLIDLYINSFDIMPVHEQLQFIELSHVFQQIDLLNSNVENNDTDNSNNNNTNNIKIDPRIFPSEVYHHFTHLKQNAEKYIHHIKTIDDFRRMTPEQILLYKKGYHYLPLNAAGTITTQNGEQQSNSGNPLIDSFFEKPELKNNLTLQQKQQQYNNENPDEPISDNLSLANQNKVHKQQYAMVTKVQKMKENIPLWATYQQFSHLVDIFNIIDENNRQTLGSLMYGTSFVNNNSWFNKDNTENNNSNTAAKLNNPDYVDATILPPGLRKIKGKDITQGFYKPLIKDLDQNALVYLNDNYLPQLSIFFPTPSSTAAQKKNAIGYYSTPGEFNVSNQVVDQIQQELKIAALRGYLEDAVGGGGGGQGPDGHFIGAAITYQQEQQLSPPSSEIPSNSSTSSDYSSFDSNSEDSNSSNSNTNTPVAYRPRHLFRVRPDLQDVLLTKLKLPTSIKDLILDSNTPQQSTSLIMPTLEPKVTKRATNKKSKNNKNGEHDINDDGPLDEVQYRSNLITTKLNNALTYFNLKIKNNVNNTTLMQLYNDDLYSLNKINHNLLLNNNTNGIEKKTKKANTQDDNNIESQHPTTLHLTQQQKEHCYHIFTEENAIDLGQLLLKYQNVNIAWLKERLNQHNNTPTAAATAAAIDMNNNIKLTPFLQKLIKNKFETLQELDQLYHLQTQYQKVNIIKTFYQLHYLFNNTPNSIKSSENQKSNQDNNNDGSILDDEPKQNIKPSQLKIISPTLEDNLKYNPNFNINKKFYLLLNKFNTFYNKVSNTLYVKYKGSNYALDNNLFQGVDFYSDEVSNDELDQMVQNPLEYCGMTPEERTFFEDYAKNKWNYKMNEILNTQVDISGNMVQTIKTNKFDELLKQSHEDQLNRMFDQQEHQQQEDQYYNENNPNIKDAIVVNNDTTNNNNTDINNNNKQNTKPPVTKSTLLPPSLQDVPTTVLPIPINNTNNNGDDINETNFIFNNNNSTSQSSAISTRVHKSILNHKKTMKYNQVIYNQIYTTLDMHATLFGVSSLSQYEQNVYNILKRQKLIQSVLHLPQETLTTILSTTTPLPNSLKDNTAPDVQEQRQLYKEKVKQIFAKKVKKMHVNFKYIVGAAQIIEKHPKLHNNQTAVIGNNQTTTTGGNVVVDANELHPNVIINNILNKRDPLTPPPAPTVNATSTTSSTTSSPSFGGNIFKVLPNIQRIYTDTVMKATTAVAKATSSSAAATKKKRATNTTSVNVTAAGLVNVPNIEQQRNILAKAQIQLEMKKINKEQQDMIQNKPVVTEATIDTTTTGSESSVPPVEVKKKVTRTKKAAAATTTITTEASQTDAPQQEEQQEQPTEETPKKRTRRTKEQIAADNAAKELLKQQKQAEKEAKKLAKEQEKLLKKTTSKSKKATTTDNDENAQSDVSPAAPLLPGVLPSTVFVDSKKKTTKKTRKKTTKAATKSDDDGNANL